MRFEVCVDSIAGVRAAYEGGAQRVELCADLLEGGTTPSLGALRLARAVKGIGLNAMIRPRGGDFLYDEDEFAAMEADIRAAKEAGADGVVLGILRADGTIDAERTAALIALARPMTVTFHRAFDMTPDAAEALETLVELGCERVLTSGQAPTALDGLPLIFELRRQADGRIIVMPGGGINAGNARKIARHSGAREMHFAALEKRESPMKFRRAELYMGDGSKGAEYSRQVTMTQRVRAIIAAAQS